MKILAIETSCDETGISIVEAKGGFKSPRFSVLSNITASQILLHAKYGGVFPMMAKREHAKNLAPILEQALKESKLWSENKQSAISDSQKNKLEKILERETGLADNLTKLVSKIKKPKLDAIAVTYGPGLEPTLWVGINFAKALSLVWDIPVIPINHMEGHVFAGLLQTAEKRGLDAEGRRKNSLKPMAYRLRPVQFPAIALLVSGGHTELVLMKDRLKYKIIGETRDDAAGEAFDKVARMLGLPYPGGPYISALAEISRKNADKTRGGAEETSKNGGRIPHKSASSLHNSAFTLPRPMLQSGDFDFSFSGLKTAVLYMIKKIPELTENIKADIAREFEEAVTEVLVMKTLAAVKKFKSKTLVLGGGVSANDSLRDVLGEMMRREHPDSLVCLPEKKLTGDNALMIAAAGYLRATRKTSGKSVKPANIKARGNLRL